MDGERTRHSVYPITYHFVWTPKYRRAVLDGPIADRLAALLHELVPVLGGEIVELVVRPDHVHLFAHFPPKWSPAQIAHRLKGATSHTLRIAFPALKPPVRCVINPKSRGAGIPDLGLYTPDQLQRAGPDLPRKAQIPARGVAEVKGLSDDVDVIAGTAQVDKYLQKYR